MYALIRKPRKKSVPIKSGNKKPEKRVRVSSRSNANNVTIQCAGEQEAINAANAGPDRLRRGNRKSSVTGTHGSSFILVNGIHGNGIHVAGLRDMMADVRLIVMKWLIEQRSYNADSSEAEVRRWWPVIEAEGVKHFRAGNCGEFASFVLTQIKENTSGQYVHKVSMTPPPYDHALVLTAPVELKNGQRADITQVMVADAWQGPNAITLQDFLNGNNPYKRKLTIDNLNIENSYWCDGTKIIPDELGKKIKDILFAGWGNLQSAMNDKNILRIAEQNALESERNGLMFDF